jgi:hypothetical protein
VKLYNAYMGRVHLFDARRRTYSTSSKSKKWWYRLFCFLLDTTVVNSYIIDKETPHMKELTLKEYILSIANTSMSLQTLRKRQRLLHHGPPSARFCECHFPTMQDKSLTCQVCWKVCTKYCYKTIAIYNLNSICRFSGIAMEVIRRNKLHYGR